MMHIEDGWLVADDGDPEVKQFRTNKFGKLAQPTPLGMVWHETGYLGVDMEEFASRQVPGSPRYSTRQASEHGIICRDGKILQLVSFTAKSWHVGNPGIVAGQHFSNVNDATVGMELESYGRMKKVDGKWCYFVDGKWLGDVPEADVRHAVQDGGYFHDFTADMVASATLVLGALVAEYGWGKDVCLYGHADFADHASREDPGPLWGCQYWKHGIYGPQVVAGVFLDPTEDQP